MTDAEIDAIVKEASEMKGNLNVIEGVKTLAAKLKESQYFGPTKAKYATIDQANLAMAFLNWSCQLETQSDDTLEVNKKATAVIGRFLSGE
jgi:hypothetical protein